MGYDWLTFKHLESSRSKYSSKNGAQNIWRQPLLIRKSVSSFDGTDFCANDQVAPPP